MKTLSRLSAVFALTAALAWPALAVQVTFQVNMEVQTELGLFSPNDDFVLVSGSFNGWSETAGILTQSATNASVYEGTFDVGAAGTFPNYKFIKSRLGIGLQWENNGVGEGGAQNRWFQVPESDSFLPVVFFNNITNVAVHYTEVTFTVDMSVQIAQGSFDPEAGSLEVAGDALNNWQIDLNPLPLTRSQSNPNLWSTTLSVTNPIGSLVSFKYVMNDTWETGADRTFVMPATPTNLPVVFFNNITNTAVPIPLTFSVNLGVQMAHGIFNPDLGDIVEVRGSFLVGPGSTWLGGFVLTNDPANPLIYSGTIMDTNSIGGTVQYQFVLNNGVTWESTGNRNATLTSTNAVAFPVAFFNNVADLGSVTMTSIANGETTLNWTSGPRIRLQSSPDLGTWNNVADTEGQSSATVSVTPDAQFFRLVGP